MLYKQSITYLGNRKYRTTWRKLKVITDGTDYVV